MSAFDPKRTLSRPRSRVRWASDCGREELKSRAGIHKNIAELSHSRVGRASPRLHRNRRSDHMHRVVVADRIPRGKL